MDINELVQEMWEGSVICMSCYKFLVCYLTFIKNCLITENRIREYCEVEEKYANGQIALNSLLLFVLKNEVGNQTKHGSVDTVKREYGTQIYNDEVEIRHESVVKIEQNLDYIQSTLDLSESDRYQDTKPLLIDKPLLSIDPEIIQEIPEVKPYKYEQHESQSYTLCSKNSSKVLLYNSETCEDQTCSKGNCPVHMVRHIYARNRASEIKLYSCAVCAFKTKYKHGLKDHMLVHKSNSEVPLYKCDICPYQTKRKRNLSGHVLTHKSASGALLYQCEMCHYQNKIKDNLRKHMLTHKCPSEVPLYTCATCTFQTRRKRNLKDHMLIHKSATEVPLFKCEICAFQTKRKRYLQNHVLVHKRNSKVPIYRCEICAFQTRYKRSIESHTLTHKSASDVPLISCEICTFQTKQE